MSVAAEAVEWVTLTFSIIHSLISAHSPWPLTSCKIHVWTLNRKVTPNVDYRVTSLAYTLYCSEMAFLEFIQPQSSAVLGFQRDHLQIGPIKMAYGCCFCIRRGILPRLTWEDCLKTWWVRIQYTIKFVWYRICKHKFLCVSGGNIKSSPKHTMKTKQQT